MNQTLTLRLAVAGVLIGIAAYFMVPTVVYFSLDDQQLAKVRQNASAFDEYVPSWAPTTHIVPGLDLQGGIHMVLGVDLEKAVSDRARRTAQRLRSTLEDKAIKTTSVDHLLQADGTGDQIKVVFADAAQKDRFKTDLMKSYFGDLAVVSESGPEMLFRVHPDYLTKLKNEAVDQTRKTIENRISKMGVSEPSIARRGDDQIQIQLPGYDDPEEAKNLIGRTAQLEFQMCDDNNDFLTKLTDLPDGVDLVNSSYGKPDNTAGKDIYLTFPEKKLTDVRAYIRKVAPSGVVVKFGRQGDNASGEPAMRTYTLTPAVELTGDDLVDASVNQGDATDNYQPSVNLEFSPAGAKIFEELTARSVGKRMAIVLEEIVDSAPVIQGRIGGGTARITMGGNRSQQEMKSDAKSLALVLKAGALPAPVQFREERSVGPSLGAAAVKAGAQACALGAILIILFMVVYYRIAGIISVLGITVNMLFVLATLSWLNNDVTLPGLAGLLLTVGMAVDANIIINERIREELRAGKSPVSAIAAGYDAAFSAIIDANVTTFIAGFVLLEYGSGPVQNFAKLLLIGTVSSVVSAIFITRIFFDVYTAKNPDKIAI